MAKGKKGRVRKAREQVHSGSLLLGLLGGVALLWSWQEWQRQQAVKARATLRRRVRPIRMRPIRARRRIPQKTPLQTAAHMI